MLADIHVHCEAPSGDPWRSNAEALADWATFMVVMWLAHGRYRPINKRDHRGPAYTLKRKATSSVLIQHFLGRYIIGLHPISPMNRSRWLAIDIDDHSLTGEKSAANRASAIAWYRQLRSWGFNPLLTESSPGSFHLLVRFDSEIPSDIAYRFGHWIVRDWSDHGLGAQPEVFPKQPQLTDRVKYGNWLRLPGWHHTQVWWSRAFDGTKWLNGADTVDHILTIKGDSPGLIPREAREFQPRGAAVRRWEQQPSVVSEPINDSLLSDLPEEIRPHVRSVAGRMQPGQRNKLTFELSRRVLSTPLDGGLPDDQTRGPNPWNPQTVDDPVRQTEDLLEARIEVLFLLVKTL